MIRAPALGLLLLLAACGPTEAVKCTASNCSGCCDDTGACIGNADQSRQSCGARGASCRVCLPDQLCDKGACLHDPNAHVELDDAGARLDAGVRDAGASDAGTPACGALGQSCCATGSPCYLSLECARGTCVTQTVDAGHCGFAREPCCAGATCTAADTVCQAGECVTSGADAGPMKPAGASCSSDGECRDGTCLTGADFPSGYCTRSCASSSDCLAGSRCGVNHTATGPANVCFGQCTTARQGAGECRAGYVCEPDVSSVPICIPSCPASRCEAAQQCDPRGVCCGRVGDTCCNDSTCNAGGTCTNHVCIQSAAGGGGGGGAGGGGGGAVGGGGGAVGGGGGAVGGGGGAVGGGGGAVGGGGGAVGGGGGAAGGGGGSTGGFVGDPCTSSTQCFDSSLLARSCLQSWPGGYCSIGCAGGVYPCPSGSNCAPLGNGIEECLLECAPAGTQGGCRSGYICDKYLIPGSQVGSCYPACTAGQCGSLQCESGFCCGGTGYKCCAQSTACLSGTCGSDGYCH